MKVVSKFDKNQLINIEDAVISQNPYKFDCFCPKNTTNYKGNLLPFELNLSYCEMKVCAEFAKNQMINTKVIVRKRKTDGRTDRRTDGQTDGQADYYRASASSMRGPN